MELGIIYVDQTQKIKFFTTSHLYLKIIDSEMNFEKEN